MERRHHPPRNPPPDYATLAVAPEPSQDYTVIVVDTDEDLRKRNPHPKKYYDIDIPPSFYINRAVRANLKIEINPHKHYSFFAVWPLIGRPLTWMDLQEYVLSAHAHMRRRVRDYRDIKFKWTYSPLHDPVLYLEGLARAYGRPHPRTGDIDVVDLPYGFRDLMLTADVQDVADKLTDLSEIIMHTDAYHVMHVRERGMLLIITELGVFVHYHRYITPSRTPEPEKNQYSHGKRIGAPIFLNFLGRVTEPLRGFFDRERDAHVDFRPLDGDFFDLPYNPRHDPYPVLSRQHGFATMFPNPKMIDVMIPLSDLELAFTRVKTEDTLQIEFLRSELERWFFHEKHLVRSQTMVSIAHWVIIGSVMGFKVIDIRNAAPWMWETVDMRVGCRDQMLMAIRSIAETGMPMDLSDVPPMGSMSFHVQVAQEVTPNTRRGDPCVQSYGVMFFATSTLSGVVFGHDCHEDRVRWAHFTELGPPGNEYDSVIAETVAATSEDYPYQVNYPELMRRAMTNARDRVIKAMEVINFTYAYNAANKKVSDGIYIGLDLFNDTFDNEMALMLNVSPIILPAIQALQKSIDTGTDAEPVVFHRTVDASPEYDIVLRNLIIVPNKDITNYFLSHDVHEVLDI